MDVNIDAMDIINELAVKIGFLEKDNIILQMQVKKLSEALEDSNKDNNEGVE